MARQHNESALRTRFVHRCTIEERHAGRYHRFSALLVHQSRHAAC